MRFQNLARNVTKKPLFMSPLAQLPTILLGFSAPFKVLLLTTSGTLPQIREHIRKECGVDTASGRYVLVDCRDVPGVTADGVIDAGQAIPGKGTVPGGSG